MKKKLIISILLILSIFLLACTDKELTRNEDYYKNSNTICTPDWACAEWGNCQEDVQKRTCVDINKCGVETEKPEESKDCVKTNSIKRLVAGENYLEIGTTYDFNGRKIMLKTIGENAVLIIVNDEVRTIKGSDTITFSTGIKIKLLAIFDSSASIILGE